MIFTLIGVLLVLGLLWFAYKRMDTLCPPARISQPVQAFDNQFEVFRDMEPQTQVRENPWVGFLQEDLSKGRTGPIGTFSGNDSKSGRAVAYMIN
jgi:hypothetical protein